MRRILLLLALLPWLLPAQDENAAPQEPPGAIHGRVTNALTGDAIAGASVHVVPVGSRGLSAHDATSQSDGTFSNENVNPGDYFVFATQAGFGSNPRARPGRIAIHVDPGQVITDIALQLTPIGMIHGTVTDPAGKPILGAQVQAFATYSVRGRAQLRRVAQTKTDEQGRYTLRTQNAGQYYVAAECESRCDVSKPEEGEQPAGETNLELVRTFYPQSLKLEGATPLDVSAGQDASDVTIRLQRAAAYHIRGKVEGWQPGSSEHAPTLSLGFRGTLASDGLGRVVRLAADGAFDISSVLSGSYTLTLIGVDNSMGGPSKGSRARLLARQDIDVGASDVDGVSLAVIPLITLSGRVGMDGISNPNAATVRVNLMPRGSGAVGGFQSIGVQSDGSFSVQNLAPGEYTVQVVGMPPGAYVKSIEYNRQDILTTGLDVTDGGGGEIDIVLRTGSGEVDGSVPGSVQVPRNAMMILVPEKPPADGSGVLLANLQPSGVFASRNVPPGRYYAFAAEGWSSLWQNPDFLRQIQNQGASVDVPENGRVQVQLPVITGDQMQAAAAPLGLIAQ